MRKLKDVNNTDETQNIKCRYVGIVRLLSQLRVSFVLNLIFKFIATQSYPICSMALMCRSCCFLSVAASMDLLLTDVLVVALLIFTILVVIVLPSILLYVKCMFLLLLLNLRQKPHEMIVSYLLF